ncbi:ABC transporter ATP-binding protein [Peptococcus simiae]|uniref:ABC transporter ATP-binding protein n=1 Tax=Peptococcus simiae TaxID=1643805 RepID=UPI0039818070
MIQIDKLSKAFGDHTALNKVTSQIRPGSIFGLIGSNGSGKSTFLRLLAGVYRADGGCCLYNQADIFENPAAKGNIFFIPDAFYIPGGASLNDLARDYSQYYPNYDLAQVQDLAKRFQLKPTARLSTFSKGMQRQAHIILALAANTPYILCDETFDGLDPVKRLLVKRILADLIADGDRSVIITSHNLRELEDFCDHIAFLHEGRLVLDREMGQLTDQLHHIQCAFDEPLGAEAFKALDLVKFSQRGRLVQFICRGDLATVMAQVRALNPLYLEQVPLTLEEVFIAEMEVQGYDTEIVAF